MGALGGTKLTGGVLGGSKLTGYALGGAKYLFTPPGLDIENDMLSVAAGGTVNLRARLNRRPSGNVVVTPSFAGNVATGNEQSLPLDSDIYVEELSSVRWDYGGSAIRPQIASSLRPNANRYFDSIRFFRTGVNNGRVELNIVSTQTGTPGNNLDLTSAFETGGTIACTAGSLDILVALAGADTTEPYLWTPANSAEVTTFGNAVAALSPDPSATLVLRDFDPTPYLSASPASLTFTQDNWDTYQDFPLAARAGSGGNSPTATLTASGATEFAGVTDDATVAIAA